MDNITIPLPDEFDQGMVPELVYFVSTMAYKLHKNRHKSTLDRTIPKMFPLLLEEIGEFMQQYLEDKTDANSLVELADAANFLFLMSMALRMEIYHVPVRARVQAGEGPSLGDSSHDPKADGSGTPV
jgi:hypothetical protein